VALEVQESYRDLLETFHYPELLNMKLIDGPNASAGVVLGLTKAGATPYGQTATAAATMDG